MNAAEILHTAQAAGVVMMASGNDLMLEAPAPPPAPLLNAIRQHKVEVIALLRQRLPFYQNAIDVHEEFEQRAAIIEHDAGIPREWAEAFARMDCCQRPAQISDKAWQNIKHYTGLLLDRHIHDIIRRGWEVAEIFGCHYAAPERRYDAMGVLLLLHDCEIIGVEHDRITLMTTTGAEQVFYRTRLTRPQERIMIWELADSGRAHSNPF